MNLLNYFCFRLFTFPLAFLSYKTLHRLGNFLGLLLFYLYPNYRKRALSNLALTGQPNPTTLAKASLQNFMITCLEYPKLFYEKEISRIATCENPQEAAALLKSGKGVIFFCGHLANWEMLFLEGTSRMPGVAIGRPIKNPYLYRFILAIRQKFGGTIVPPKNGLKEGLKALKAGKFFGIVGDQGMPDSPFSSSFLGKRAWTSSLPALLSLRSGCPIIVASCRREKGHYFIHYSDPIWPTTDADTLMHTTLSLFEKSILAHPGQWLWIHNRWKQQLPGRLNKKFRYESIALIFPDDPTLIASFASIRTLYPTEFLTAFVPAHIKTALSPDIEIKSYHTFSDILIPDYRFKLVLNLTSFPLKSHFLSLSAFHVHTLKNFEELCQASGFTPKISPQS